METVSDPNFIPPLIANPGFIAPLIVNLTIGHFISYCGLGSVVGPAQPPMFATTPPHTTQWYGLDSVAAVSNTCAASSRVGIITNARIPSALAIRLGKSGWS